MSKVGMASGAFCRTLTLGIISILAGKANGFSRTMLLPKGIFVLKQTFGEISPFRRTTTIVVRRMTVSNSADSTTIKTELPPGGTVGRTGEAMSSLPSSLKVWFDIPLPEGRCIGVEAINENECFPQIPSDGVQAISSDHWIHSVFHPGEIDLAINSGKANINSFWLGRLAMRIALGFPDYPILRDGNGRPKLHGEIFGSISHKQDKGVAMISPPKVDDEDSNFILSGVGVDLEMTSRPGKRSISKRVLTANEQQSLGNLPDITVDEEVLLRFSLKEAIYKASHPLLCQYVGMREAEVTPFADGTASCVWLLDNDADKRIAKMTAHWRKLPNGQHFLTSACVFTKLEMAPDQ